ncbi:MAG TPA: hypothetical protein VEQ60_18115 [Longimicrobium sp.]|nr:hypothetical protein [Longimicrobium sp.]
MTPRFLVESALIGEAVILFLSLLILFGHGWRAARREKRWRVPVERGRLALLEVIRNGRPTRPDEQLLRSLPVRLQVRLFTELVPSITGASRDHLARLAQEIGLVPVAERMASAKDWRDRLHGVRLLAAVGGGEHVVPKLLDDPDPAVRAEAVEWAGSNPTPELIDRLVQLLPRTDRYGSFVVRDSLLRVGADVIPPLARYLEKHNGRHAEPALDVAAGLPDVRFAPAALGRLGHWPSATVIAPLLRDRAWIVRSQSALALRALGSPGLLYLRKGLSDEDAFAADIARQVLDLPDSSAERERWT